MANIFKYIIIEIKLNYILVYHKGYSSTFWKTIEVIMKLQVGEKITKNFS